MREIALRCLANSAASLGSLAAAFRSASTALRSPLLGSLRSVASARASAARFLAAVICVSTFARCSRHSVVGRLTAVLRLTLRMRCPHCLDNFHPSRYSYEIEDEATVLWTTCPACHKLIIFLRLPGEPRPLMIYPDTVARASLPDVVPERIAQDFREACEVQSISQKASAALSRRLLQGLLREYGKVKGRNLEAEIEAAMPNLPHHIANALDAVRHVGNFATHPLKSGSTGEVVEVEEGEAEWLLDTVEALIGLYIDQPAALAQKREALDAKLDDMGKPPLKSVDAPAELEAG